MSKIEKLINKLCPDGVEIKTLGEVCEKIFAGGTPSTRKKEYYGGDISWLRSGEVNFNVIRNTEFKITELGLQKSSARWIKKNSVLLAMTGATVARSAVNIIPLTANQSVCALEVSNELNYKFLYYCLANNYQKIKQMGQGVLTSLNLSNIKKIQVPVPPLEIQEEIVYILDKFTELQKELNKELGLRKKQYEYYRNKLLSKEELEKRSGREVEFKTFGEMCEYTRGVTYSKNMEINDNNGNNEGSWKVLRANNISLNSNTLNFEDVKQINKNVKVSDKQKLKENDILICVGSGSKEHIGKIAFVHKDIDYIFGGFMGVIRSKMLSLNSRFLFFYLGSSYFTNYLKSSLYTSTINNLKSSIINKFQIPVPPLEVQNEIVNILDKFDALINGLKGSIPDEIKLRRKQYEYYREKLLTFKENMRASA